MTDPLPAGATGPPRRVSVDLEAATVTVEDAHGERVHGFDQPEAFDAVSAAWLRVGWDTKYVYSFTWMGRPLIQLPEDVLRLQEAVYRARPDVIIETGVAHGGSLILYASLCKALGRGRVVGIDIEIRPHNRKAIEAHELFEHITLLEGSSTDPRIVEQVRSLIHPDERVLVILDGNHTKAHVLEELELYAPLVSVDSYIIAADGLMQDLAAAPRTQPDWTWNNPAEAAKEFVATHPDFLLGEPGPDFNEGVVERYVTYFKSGWLKRIR